MIKTSISLKRKGTSKRKTPFFCILKGLSNKEKVFFMSCALPSIAYVFHKAINYNVKITTKEKPRKVDALINCLEIDSVQRLVLKKETFALNLICVLFYTC